MKKLLGVQLVEICAGMVHGKFCWLSDFIVLPC